MDIIGIGIDLVRISRLQAAEKRWGHRFMDRVFTPQEIAYAREHKFPHPHLAGQFAAKEAVLKAIGTGWAGGCRWKDIEVAHEPSGAPRVILAGKVREITSQKGVERVFLSITHDHDYAIAQVLFTGPVHQQGSVRPDESRFSR